MKYVLLLTVLFSLTLSPDAAHAVRSIGDEDEGLRRPWGEGAVMTRIHDDAPEVCQWAGKPLIYIKPEPCHKEAEKGNPYALFMTAEYGKMALEDKERNPEEEITFFTRAFEQGVAFAAYRLGDLYRYGVEEKLPQNAQQAIDWYKKAGDSGYYPAYTMIGDMYHFGLLVEKDYKEAIIWYEKAAVQEDPIAQYMMGQSHMQEYGVEYDLEKARQWFQKAADIGLLSAQYWLGMAYYHDSQIGTTELFQAYYWFEVGARKDFEHAVYAIYMLAPMLEAETRKQARELARRWSPKKPKLPLGNMPQQDISGKQSVPVTDNAS